MLIRKVVPRGCVAFSGKAAQVGDNAPNESISKWRKQIRCPMAITAWTKIYDKSKLLVDGMASRWKELIMQRIVTSASLELISTMAAPFGEKTLLTNVFFLGTYVNLFIL